MTYRIYKIVNYKYRVDFYKLDHWFYSSCFASLDEAKEFGEKYKDSTFFPSRNFHRWVIGNKILTLDLRKDKHTLCGCGLMIPDVMMERHLIETPHEVVAVLKNDPNMKLRCPRVYCETCKVELSALHNNRHLLTKRHARNLEKSKQNV